ncbi:MAG: ribbon-helix-helix domain-containing protein [Actinobacteria bacterium]|nr:ribbon-helix-helix domain-containing protein [Actinomycetota bacterium]
MTREGRNEVQLAIRMPRELVSGLDALVPEVHATRAEAVRQAVQGYLYRLACERDAQRYANSPLDDAELALADSPDAWSATPSW